MRQPDNIRGVLAAEPDFIGYIFYPKSKRYVGENPTMEIFDLVPESTQKVAVFVNETVEQVQRICKHFTIVFAQLHGNESPEYCRQIKDAGIWVIKAFAVDQNFDFKSLNAYQAEVDYFLFDTKGKLPGGTGLKFDWSVLENYQLSVPFLLSGGIGPDDEVALNAFAHEQLVGLDINSGFELEPALKDEQKVKAFVEAIRS
ncbi:phosphoribosylanthranilate isomerase [Sunxiuqinia elliptica]|uniref:N-(5'-phosphoribosyl)anthranilate isomerase n=2 Tax=Sunxiuqinia elliptica TaxID=655355 RepID=A0A4R6H7F2_9BACT|nr:phosphoribosylanthranilate isomerase [Sunxiuqinia elliptica]